MGLYNIKKKPLKKNEIGIGGYMSIWKPYAPYKAGVHEMKNRRKGTLSTFPTLCRICGQPLKNDKYNVCKSCQDFVNQKRNEERKHKK